MFIQSRSFPQGSSKATIGTPAGTKPRETAEKVSAICLAKSREGCPDQATPLPLQGRFFF